MTRRFLSVAVLTVPVWHLYHLILIWNSIHEFYDIWRITNIPSLNNQRNSTYHRFDQLCIIRYLYCHASNGRLLVLHAVCCLPHLAVAVTIRAVITRALQCTRGLTFVTSFKLMDLTIINFYCLYGFSHWCTMLLKNTL